ncbi:hypothetical protein SDC9_107191 [bioreactor metagenome]|uniref:Fatty acid kinase subunit A-like middle domain-containing protein n=1 Tax=bioreactor metagenome TaxID=1076179 RepID=A0A645B4E7_9ZZZZ
MKAAVKHKLKDIGDSLMVAVNEDRMRIHVHINDPSQLTDLTSEYGTFLEQKADDMFLQLAIRRERLSTIGLVTDSIADLPDQYKLEHQIVTIPLGIQLGDSVYLDKLTIKPEKVFSAIHHGKQASSSQPEPLRIRNLLENLLDHYDSLIIIAVSAKLSGTYLSIKQEADRLIQQGKQIILIDSRLNSGAQGLLVKKAAEYIQQGYRYDEITEKILDLRSRISIYVCLNTLEYAVHSGRVPNTIGKLGMKMRLRPIMSLDKEGKGTAFGVGLTQKGITRQIYRLIDSKLRRNGISAYSIVHCGNPELAAEYQLALTEMIGRKPEYVYDISAIIAMHSGPGCVAVSFIEGKED